MKKLLLAGIAVLSVLYASAAAQQGNLPTPVGKLPPYPPIVCVTPNWTPEVAVLLVTNVTFSTRRDMSYS